MKAVVYHKFGSPEVLKIETVEKPVPKSDEVLIEVYASSVNSGDYHMRSGKPFMARVFAGPFTPRNKRLGSTLSGVVVGSGEGVTQFELGDEVFASVGMKAGANAQYYVMPESGVIVSKPKNITFEEAASLPFGNLSSKYFLNKAGVQEADHVLVIGASGGVGSAAVQMAKYYGANVTGMCSTNNVDFVKSIGADNIIDYKKEDLKNHKEKYDLIFDMSAKTPTKVIDNILSDNGVYITTVMKMSVLFKMMTSKNKKFIFDINKEDKSDLEFIKTLVESDKIRPVIDQVYPMIDIQKAHTHVETKSKQGNVIIKLK